MLQQAYRRWVCSSLVPLVVKNNSTGADGKDGGGGGWGRAKPCRSVCQTVEQQCPYFLPGDRAPAHPTQYAGEPTFLCLGKPKKSLYSNSIHKTTSTKKHFVYKGINKLCSTWNLEDVLL